MFEVGAGEGIAAGEKTLLLQNEVCPLNFLR